MINDLEPNIAPAQTAKKPKVLAKAGEERVKIILNDNPDIPPTGLPVSVNGWAYIIRPGEEVEVPISVINVLNDAVQSQPLIDQQTGQVLGWRDSMRFPYRRL